MKSYTKLFIAVFFILIAVRTVKSDYFSVSGTIRYADNNEIVQTGIVKCYDVNTCQLLGQAEIQPTGDYLLSMIAGQTDLIGLPNLDPEVDQFVPTGYPDRTQSSLYVHVFVDQDLSGIDIYVQRREPGGNSPFTASISGIVLNNNNMPIGDAIVYAKQGNDNYGFAITNTKGEYTIKSLQFGDYTISANRVSAITNEVKVTLIGNGLSNVNFKMEKIKPVNNNIAPVTYKLSQNFPNPFNPSTTIKYSVAVRGMVMLQVYNAVGQLAEELVNETQDAGVYEIRFDASALSSGVYFYKLTAGSYTDSKKMTLIR